MNLREMAEAAGFWGWTVWPEELKTFAHLVSQATLASQKASLDAAAATAHILAADTSLTDAPSPTLPPTP